jgi:hypothetical protein
LSYAVEGAFVDMDVHGSGERALALAVLERALSDAATDGAEGGDAQLEKERAYLFCTAPEGRWAKARNMWCDRAGLTPDYFATHARKVLRA